VKILREYAFWPNEANAVCGLLFVEDEHGNRSTLRSDLALLQLIRFTSRPRTPRLSSGTVSPGLCSNAVIGRRRASAKITPMS
jgi:hypothetical protein